MARAQKNVRTCANGHLFKKSSDCPTCPVCEAQRKPKSGFLSVLSAPARRALENNGIATLVKLSKYTESEILQLHGMGPGSIPKLKAALRDGGLAFRISKSTDKTSPVRNTERAHRSESLHPKS